MTNRDRAFLALLGCATALLSGVIGGAVAAKVLVEVVYRILSPF